MENKLVEPAEDNQGTIDTALTTDNDTTVSDALLSIESEPISSNQTPVAHRFIQEPKRSKKPLIIGLFVILLLLAIGAAAYYFLVTNKPVEKVASVVQTHRKNTKINSQNARRGGRKGLERYERTYRKNNCHIRRG